MGKRMKVLGARRTTVIVTLAVLLLAVAVVIGSGANFTSQATNVGNTFTAGTLTLVNETPAAQFAVTNMVPGETRWADFDLRNDGSVAGALSMSLGNFTGTGLEGALTYDAYVDGTRVVDDAPLAAGTAALGTMAPGSHTYRIEVTFPDGTPDHDNPYQGLSTTFDLTWDLVSTPT